MQIPREVRGALGGLITTLAGFMFARLLNRFMERSIARGLAFFTVFVVFTLLFGKRARLNLWLRLTVCLGMGLIAYVGSVIWPSW